MEYTVRPVTIDDYGSMLMLWGSSEQNLQKLDPTEDDYDGIARYLKRNSNSCFAAEKDGNMIGMVLSGLYGHRAVIRQTCVHPDYQRMGIDACLVALAEEALAKEVASDI